MSLSRLSLGAASLLCIVSAASAAVSFTGNYSENFDSIGPAATAPPAEWTAGRLAGSPGASRDATGGGAAVSETLVVADGTAGVANGTVAVVGRSYNIGTTDAADRAIGGAGTTSGATGGDRILQVALTNNTGAAISSMTIGYTGEQWRFAQGASSSGAEMIRCFYRTSPDSGWTSVNLDFTAPWQTPAQSGLSINTSLDGNLPANRIVLSAEFALPASLPDGGSFYVRWQDWNDNSTSDSILAVDDVSISVAVPEPASLSVLMVGGLLLGRRRRD